MSNFYIVTKKQQGHPDHITYHATRNNAEEQRELLLTIRMQKHLRTANKIKGALRGRGRPTLNILAAGIVAEEYSVEIVKAYLRGDAQ